jgi:hypothetical protein
LEAKMDMHSRICISCGLPRHTSHYIKKKKNHR